MEKKSPQDLLRQAKELLDNDNTSEAFKLLDEALEIDPKFKDALTTKALTL